MFRKEWRRESRHRIAEMGRVIVTERKRSGVWVRQLALALARFRAIRCCIQCCLVEINTKHVAGKKGPGDDSDGAG